MKSTRRSLGLAFLAVFVLPAALSASWQGDKKAPPKDDPEVPALIKALTPIIKSKSKDGRDGEGGGILDKLSNLYPKLNAKQQKAVVKAVTTVFRARRKPDEVTMYLAAGEALSRFGKPGADALAKAINDRRWKNKKEWSTFRSQLVRLLGRPAEKKYINFLLDIALKDNDDQARAKAGEALGDYAKYPDKERKQIVEKLVKHLEQVWAQSKSSLDPNNLDVKIWADRYAAIQDPWMRTLKKHTGQDLRDVQGWTTWWNKNKRKSWDKEGFRGVANK